jgi:esterase/lipase superfamily enzyme
MYYGTPIAQQANSLGKQQTQDFHFSTLDMLTNPLREPEPFELWSPREVALFETCICKYGKNFSEFAHFIPTKSKEEIAAFYTLWKHSSHYQSWNRKQQALQAKDQNKWVFNL